MTVESQAAGTVPVDETDLRRRLAALTLEQKIRLLTGADFWGLHPEPAAGLRRMVTSDGPAGVRGELWEERDPSANVPSPTALAASWDEARVERIGRLLAGEARAKGVDVLLAPTVNLHRTPHGGRHFECLSEDPLLTARMGAAYVRGVQAGGVAATVKHFVANDSETDRFTLDAHVDERALRELYLEPFDVIVRQAGAWAVMAAYNSVNGITMTEHPMLRQVLKDEWGFDGVVMSDWFATRTTEAAGNAALDVAMPGPGGPWGDKLLAAVRRGDVPADAVDEKVLRLLRLAARVGALQGVAPATPAASPWPAERVSAELRGAAAAGFVLGHNVDVGATPPLPLQADGLRRVAVLGPNAAEARTLGGGSATVFPPYTVSPLDGLRVALGGDVEVTHAPGVRPSDRLPASTEFLRLPDGGDEAGVELRFLAADGTELGREHRAVASFTWIGSFVPGVAIDDVSAVEVHTRLRSPADGVYLVGGSGVGPFRLTVDGKVLFDTRIELPPGADPVEGIMRPPQHAVPVRARAGRDTRIVLRFEPGHGPGFGEAEVALATFHINVMPRPGDPEEELERAVALARDADVAVVVVGTTEEVESEGFDRDSLALPGRQDELVRRVAGVNPRTVVVVNSGAPVLLPWADEVPAVVLAWFPGQEFGRALADVLLGAVEPGGRLPVSWPRSEDNLPSTQPVDGVLTYDEGLYIGYRGYDRDGREPLYRFGHGLGYTSWEYLTVAAPTAVTADGVTIQVRVRNSGSRSGREVVQAYLSKPGGTVERPTKWLAGFAGVHAPAGQEADAEIRLPVRAFAHWDAATSKWAVEAGTYRIDVGSSSGELPLTATVEVP
jgi:beta-glucosidase